MDPILPVFPLNLIAFPGEQINLHIFEPRYRELIKEVKENKSTFGIPGVLNDKLCEIGTEMELVQITKTYPDGKMDVQVRGVGLFKVHEFLKEMPGKLFGGVRYEEVYFDLMANKDKMGRIYEMVQTLFSLLNIEKAVPEDPLDFTTFEIGHYAGLSQDQEYELLCISGENDRQDFIIQHLESMIPLVRQVETLQDKVKMNGDYRLFQSPEL